MKLDFYEFNEGNAKGIKIYTTAEYFKVYENGNTDPEMVNDMISEELNNKTIFDVGAFIGLSSMVFSKYSKNCKIIAFEPNPYNRKKIEKNFEKNKKISANIRVFPYALSNANASVKMYLSKVIEGPSSTSRIEGSHSTISNDNLPNCFEYQIVETKTLDSFVSKNKLIPDIIKIDIEGAEFMLLLGAINTISKYHPLIYIELHSEYCAYKCTEFLINQGYVLSLIKEESDNRIMIKAKYAEKIEKDLLIQNYENSIYSINNLLKSQYDFIKAEFKKMDFQKDLENLKLENKKIKNEYDMLKQQQRNYIEENEIIKKSNTEINNYLNDILNSKSWRITKPLRNLTNLFKRK